MLENLLESTNILTFLRRRFNAILESCRKLFYTPSRRWLMARTSNLKNRTPVGTTLNNEIYSRLKAYSEESMIPISKILDKAIDQFLKSQGK